MFFLRRLQCTRLMQENKDGNGDAGGGKPPEKNPPANSPATGPTAEQIQATIDTAVAAAVAKNNLERDANEKGLKETKDSLLEQNKKHKDKIRDNELKQRMLDGDVDKVTKEIEARIKKENAEKVTGFEKEIENLKKEGHNKSIESVVDALNDGCNIMSELREARKLQILNDSEFTTDDSGNILIDGKNPNEFISDWLENGKNVDTWRAANQSSGGGANGSKGSTGSQKSNSEVLSKLDGGAMHAAASEMHNK